MNKNWDILIMTASFGNGHNSATSAIKENLLHLFPDTKVCVADLFEIISPSLKETYSEIYNILTRTKFPVYNGFYNLRNSKDNVIDDIALNLYYKKVDTYLATVQPKMIISVFPTCAHFAAHYKHEYNPDLKMVTVITDVVGNWEWVHQDTDIYFVPSLEVKESLVQKGVKVEQIFVTGVPVKREFSDTWESSSDIKKVLVMASSMDIIKFSNKVLKALGEMPYHFTIVTGKNEALRAALAMMDIPQNTHVLGFSKDIPRLMRESDLIVTKPGGATIFEAIESDLPMLIKDSRVGQEIYNIDFIYRYGLGDSFDKDHELLEKIPRLLNNNKYNARIVENIRQFKSSLDKRSAYLRLKQMISAKKLEPTQ